MAIIDGTGRAGTVPMGVGKDMQAEMSGVSGVKGMPGKSDKESGFKLSADRVSISERARRASDAIRPDEEAAKSREAQQDTSLTWTTVEIKNPRKG